MADQQMDEQARRQLHHDILGRLNGLMLCTAAIESVTDRAEQLEFLEDIERLCDKLENLMARLEAMEAAAS